MINMNFRLILFFAFFVLSNVIFGQEHEERQVVEG